MNNIASDDTSDISEQIQTENETPENETTENETQENETTENETQENETPENVLQIDYSSLEEGTYNNVESMLLNLLETYEDFNTQSTITPRSSIPSFIPLTPPASLTPSIPPAPRLVRNNNIPYLESPITDISTNINYTIPLSMSLPIGDILNSNSSLGDNYTTRFRSLFRPFTNQNNSLNEIINSTLNEPSQSVYKNVMNDEAKKIIKIEKYKKEKYKDQCTCMITLNDFKNDDEIAVLPCNHIFNKIAIFKWLKTEDARCPICRTELPSKEVKKNINETTNSSEQITEEIQNPSGDIITPSGENLQSLRRERYSRLFTNMINRELIRQEDEDLEMAILESLRTQN